VCVVYYVPPSGNANMAAKVITDCVHRHLQNKPDAPMLILGDFNHCSLDKTLLGFHQYVKCSSRYNSSLYLINAMAISRMPIQLEPDPL